MQWFSSVSVASSFEVAYEELADSLSGQLQALSPQLLLAFVSPHHREHYVRLHHRLRSHWPAATLLGCSASGVIGESQEVEQSPGLSVMAGVLPDTEIHPFVFEQDDLLSGGKPLDLPHDSPVDFIVLADPLSIDTSALLRVLDSRFQHSTKIGGLASGGNQPGQNLLYCGDQVQAVGAVGLAIRGNCRIESLVAQGCRPIGPPLFVTRSEANLILELDGRIPAELLQDLHAHLPERDQHLMRSSLFLGLVMQGGLEVYRQGDFLVRNIVGVDPRTGALAIGAVVPQNSVVQFHVRDRDTSAQELDLLLRGYVSQGHEPAGAIVFSCLGRGKLLFGTPNHDTDLLRTHLGSVPVGGCFCGGEIGPVKGRTFLHGYTSVIGFFRPRE